MGKNFDEFLSNIEPSTGQTKDLQDAHQELKEKLLADERTRDLVDSVFLQGSYKRSTLVKAIGDDKPDIDVVVVTTLDEGNTTPQEAEDAFKEFLDDEYPGWEPNSRSMCITKPRVKMDMVVTAAPEASQQKALLRAFSNNAETVSNASFASLLQKMDAETTLEALAMNKAATRPVPANWRDYPLKIPDRDVKKWEATNPLAQMTWTTMKNAKTSGDYIRIVKALKWWRRNWKETRGMPHYPKGYPLEHLIGECCPDGSMTLEDRVAKTLTNMHRSYEKDVQAGKVPVLIDHGVKTHNVLKRIKADEFSQFHSKVGEAARIAQRAASTQDVDEAAIQWRELFGSEFPGPSVDGRPSGPPSSPRQSTPFPASSGPSKPQSVRFA